MQLRRASDQSHTFSDESCRVMGKVLFHLGKTVDSDQPDDRDTVSPKPMHPSVGQPKQTTPPEKVSSMQESKKKTTGPRERNQRKQEQVSKARSQPEDTLSRPQNPSNQKKVP